MTILPCFDDADTRRGKPAVHKAFSEPLAVLTGDSLIVMAFEVLARAASIDADRAAKLMLVLANRTGMPNGICAGQGWESEDEIDLRAYHRAKTGALFIAATQMGAIAAGQDAEPWEELGARIGEAFQVADDLRDALYDAETLGKPVGQDDLHGRPNAVTELGVEGAIARMKDILGGCNRFDSKMSRRGDACPIGQRSIRSTDPDEMAYITTIDHTRRIMADNPLEPTAHNRKRFSVLGWQARLIASRKFQKWAAQSLFTRRLVRREGEALFDLLAGFCHSQILMALVKFNIPTILMSGPMKTDLLAAQCNVPPKRMAILLRAGAALGLLKSRNGKKYALTRTGAALVGVPRACLK